MIIKGKRDSREVEEEPRAQPKPVVLQRPSSIIKGPQGAPPPASVPPAVRKSSVFKRGSYSLAPDAPAEDEGPQASEEMPPPADQVVRIPTGDEPPSPPPGLPDAPEAPRVDVVVPSGPPVDQQVLEEAKRRAEAIVRQAQMEAKKLLEESKAYCQTAMQQAQQQGFEIGRQEGIQHGKLEMADLVRQARTVFAQSTSQRELFLRSCQGEIAQMAMKLAERLLGTAVEQDGEVIKNQVAQALERVKDREHISIHVSPADLELARANRAFFEKMVESPKTFEIVGDNKVDRGGCVIETNLGNVDARIATQFGAMQLAFEEIERQQREEWAMAAENAAREVMAQGPPEPEPEPQPPQEEAV